MYFIILIIPKFTPHLWLLHGHQTRRLPAMPDTLFPASRVKLFNSFDKGCPLLPQLLFSSRTWLVFNHFTSMTHCLVFRNISSFCLYYQAISLFLDEVEHQLCHPHPNSLLPTSVLTHIGPGS